MTFDNLLFGIKAKKAEGDGETPTYQVKKSEIDELSVLKALVESTSKCNS